jgi:uroporphyrin-III C-methyltransferase
MTRGTASLPGKVFLIGAGPGDPELLTRKAARILESADIVLHDSLVSAEILALIPATVQRIDVGKRRGFRLLSQGEINSLLVASAQEHATVVRLKGGDPLLFGRAAEEIEALRTAHVPFEIVPGISAAFGAAAAAQVSLTDRRLASHVLFTTYSRSLGANLLPVLGINSETTIVVYMPGPGYSGVSHWLLESGIAAEMPCLVISKASQREQAQSITTLSRLASLPPLPAPALLIVGRVAAQTSDSATALSWLLDSPDEVLQKSSIS